MSEIFSNRPIDWAENIIAIEQEIASLDEIDLGAVRDSDEFVEFHKRIEELEGEINELFELPNTEITYDTRCDTYRAFAKIQSLMLRLETAQVDIDDAEDVEEVVFNSEVILDIIDAAIKSEDVDFLLSMTQECVEILSELGDFLAISEVYDLIDEEYKRLDKEFIMDADEKLQIANIVREIHDRFHDVMPKDED